jgi:K+-sensing histidine kinase KdpD
MTRAVPKWLWAFATIAAVLVIGAVDLVTGFEMNFFVFYFWPVSMAAWHVGKGSSVWLSVLSALVWFTADTLSGHMHSWHFYAVWNTMVRLLSFVAFGLLVSRVRQLLADQRKLAEELQRAISEVKVLETFLPICSKCKKIRDQEGSWRELEEYISAHSNTLFSHGYCPECARKAMIEAGLIGK